MGAELSLWWGVPFAGMLLSIAMFPIAAPHFWHAHFRKISIGWFLLLAVPFLQQYRGHALHELIHVLIADYLPFLIFLWGLYAVAGGIVIDGSLPGTPKTNALLLLVGTAIASIVGTTGATMLLVRPLLRANALRRHRTHTIVFFIFLVGNIGGSLTPLGDPPLFIGFLHGVPFFWTTRHLWRESLLTAGLVFAVYLVWESLQYRRERNRAEIAAQRSTGLAIRGQWNLLALGGIIMAILISGNWKPTTLQLGKWIVDGHVQVDLHSLEHLLGEPPRRVAGVVAMAHHSTIAIPVQNLTRDLLVVAFGLLSVKWTDRALRAANGFTWFPIKEVAWLFFGIFTTIVPVIAILAVGRAGQLRFIFDLVQSPREYFVATGLLSSFLDNAPTYLTFFKSTLGKFYAGLPEAQAVGKLIVERVDYLAAISAGAVFMGANTYIGNAPNFMVKSIAEEANVRMPNFFAYFFLYALPVLGPIFAIVAVTFF